jgi:hypothetical protein
VFARCTGPDEQQMYVSARYLLLCWRCTAALKITQHSVLCLSAAKPFNGV